MMIAKIIAFALFGIFYAAYFGKKAVQRRQGIQTNQIGVGSKPKRVLRIERLMGAATLLVVPVEVLSIVVFPQWTLIPQVRDCPALQYPRKIRRNWCKRVSIASVAIPLLWGST